MALEASSHPTEPDSIDRESPRIRPDRWVVMYQNWRHLLFLHWAVDPELLRPLIPEGLDLDTFEGRAYVGLTPFTMTGVRPVGLPAFPPFSNFHETNLRTYVHRSGRDPGVWFFSLDASSRLAVLGARTVLGLPYYSARIRFAIDHEDDGEPTIDYALQRRRPSTPRCEVRYRPRGPSEFATLGSLEFFLVERYLLYSVWAGRLYLMRIHHPPWPLQSAEFTGLNETLFSAAGIKRPDATPLAHYAREVRAEVFRSERVGRKGQSPLPG